MQKKLEVATESVSPSEIDEWEVKRERSQIGRVAALLRRCGLFADVSRDVVAFIAAQPSTRIEVKKKGENFYEKNKTTTEVSMLLKGLGVVTGDEGLVTFRHPSQQIGLTLVMSTANAESTCQALVDSEIIVISRDTMMAAMTLDVALIKASFTCHVERNRVLQYRLDLARRHDKYTMHRRFWSFLAQLDHVMRRYEDFWGEPMDIGLERQQVARLLNISNDHFRKNIVKPLLDAADPVFEWDHAGRITIRPRFQRDYEEYILKTGFGEI